MRQLLLYQDTCAYRKPKLQGLDYPKWEEVALGWWRIIHLYSLKLILICSVCRCNSPAWDCCSHYYALKKQCLQCEASFLPSLPWETCGPLDSIFICFSHFKCHYPIPARNILKSWIPATPKAPIQSRKIKKGPPKQKKWSSQTPDFKGLLSWLDQWKTSSHNSIPYPYVLVWLR